MIRQPPRSTQGVSSAASDVYKRQVSTQSTWELKREITTETKTNTLKPTPASNKQKQKTHQENHPNTKTTVKKNEKERIILKPGNGQTHEKQKINKKQIDPQKNEDLSTLDTQNILKHAQPTQQLLSLIHI
eukprot:TRINITY_DN55700_c0_g1_i2.p2 TRINITY_DN55700_c0_g1~~TRINITY_DN55700_c0_g1_i2.p2  ORF type:complete len:131 (+),score=31.89 TRINITY_DN55700_c0_g1_i2:92-484(+)